MELTLTGARDPAGLAGTFIDMTRGRFFRVVFTKKDGSLRRMVARTGVTSHRKGGKLAFNPAERGLRVVFDVQKGEYRMINLNTVQEVRCGGLALRRAA